MRHDKLIENGFDHGVFDRSLISEDIWSNYFFNLDPLDEMDTFDTFEVFITSDTIEFFPGDVIRPIDIPWDVCMLIYLGDLDDKARERLFSEFVKLMDRPELLI
ncbi:hypothetical protein WCWAEYFT_CDS0230 [Vibrio phage VB_VaC_TDDLMA]